uniref:Protein kinase domain-containing protein n=1 Tax=Parascaris univalens TaxID=6257 RepID=A0A915AJ15_PARUN
MCLRMCARLVMFVALSVSYIFISAPASPPSLLTYCSICLCCCSIRKSFKSHFFQRLPQKRNKFLLGFLRSRAYESSRIGNTTRLPIILKQKLVCMNFFMHDVFFEREVSLDAQALLFYFYHLNLWPTRGVVLLFPHLIS